MHRSRRVSRCYAWVSPCAETATNGDSTVAAAVESADHFTSMQRFLIVLGLVLLAVGVLWPWLSRLGLGRLPGDIRIERDGFVFYLPLTTGLIVSILLSLILWLLRQ